MSLPRLLSRELTISARLVVWFLTISLVPSGVLTLLVSSISARSLEKTVRRGLLVIAEAKTTALESLIRERRNDAVIAGRLPFVVQATRRLNEVLAKEVIDSPAYEKESALARPVISVYMDAYGFANVYLFDGNGRLLFRVEKDVEMGPNLLEGPLRGSRLADAFVRSKALMQAVFADIQVYPGVQEPRLFVLSPVFDENGLMIGVVALQLENRTLYRILEDFTGLGETGEIRAAQLNADEVVHVAPTRFDPKATFNRRARVGGPDEIPLQRAAQGDRGFGWFVDDRGNPVVAVWTYVPSLRWGVVVQQAEREAYAMVNQQRAAVAGLLLLTLVGVISVALLVANNLSRPVRAAAEVAQKVAQGDLTARFEVRGKGELGQLLLAVTTMTQDLRSLIGKIQKSSIALMSTATEIAATSRQQEQTLHDHGASTSEAAAAVREISATGQELLKTMNELNEVAAQTAEMASHGQDSLSGMDTTMRLLAESTASISSKLSVISERAANINFVVTTITKVADQTNLLSINAAIEAEKAGEYGLGFLVVAREIRRLAEMTAVSTLDIERMVKEMQYSVSAGVMEMDKFSDQVRQGVVEVGQINEKLNHIITAVQGLTERFDQVTDGMSVQAQGADQIRESVMRLSEGATQTLASLREFNMATAQLREAVGGLKEEVSRFRVEPAATRP